MDKLKSRKLILAVVAAFVAFGNGLWGWGLTTDQVWAFISPVVAYILGNSYITANGGKA